MENVIKIVSKEGRINQKFIDHKLCLDNRKKLSLTGVEKVISANENQVIAKTGNSKLYIHGKNLEVSKLDIDSGILDLIGEVFSMKYSGSSSPKGFFRRLFG